MLNAFTVDVEDWYMTSDLNISPDQWGFYEDRIERNTHFVLDLMDEYAIRGTFFVLGCVAKSHPELIREIASRGHEVASHGGWHQMLTRMDRKSIHQDLQFSRKVLEDTIGSTIKGFRAPSWSLSPSTYEVLLMLEEDGYVYDSSMQPFRTPLSGIKHAPIAPFHPIVFGKQLSLVEVPSTVLRKGALTLPFFGGLYLRTLPAQWIIRALQMVNRERAGMIYVHPWEFDRNQPRVAKNRITQFTHYHNLDSTEVKVRNLLEHFEFQPLEQLLIGSDYPSAILRGDGVS